MPTDASGDITLTITPAPGAKVEFTRDPAAQSPICNPMESPVDVPLPAPGTTRTVTLANTTGDPFDPGLSDAERGVIGQLNGYRAAHGLAPLAISTSLSSAASAVAHDAAVVKAKAGSYPFPPPFCDAIAQDFDWPGTGVGSLDASTTDPHAAYAHWSDSSARGKQTLNPHWTAAGIGDGGGAWIVIYGACPSGAETRCGMTSDQGDASLYPGAAGTPQVAAPGGGGTPQADGTPQGGGAPQGGQGIAAASGLSLSPRSFAAVPSGPRAVAAGRARAARRSATRSARRQACASPSGGRWRATGSARASPRAASSRRHAAASRGSARAW
jgi:uncharacterized protein YkwD